MAEADPYKVLQVDSEAEIEVIEAAYRRLARKYHPDVAETADAQERMVAINRAWEELRDPARRAAVDRVRERAAAGARGVGIGRPMPGDGGLRPGAPPVAEPGVTSRPARPRRSWSAGSDEPGGQAGEGSAGPPPGNPSGSVLQFGRYSGWSLGEIVRRDPEYLEWLERSSMGRAYRLELDSLLRARGRRGTKGGAGGSGDPSRGR